MTSYSYCRNFGKDKVIFVTKEDHAKPSTIELPPPEPAPGILTNDGDINWGCPCLGGMTTGPCGVEFREAFSCFHYSDADPKGSDCFDSFRTMQECFTKYPTVYNKSGGGDADEDNGLDIPGMEDIKDDDAITEDIEEYKSITTEMPPSQAIEKK